MNTGKIREYLDYGLDEIEGETLDRLEEAREQALARYRMHTYSVEIAGHGISHSFHPRLGVWLPAAALIFGICAILYWGNTAQKNVDQTDEDTALLADDLPVPAYTDQKFFDSWLKRSQH